MNSKESFHLLINLTDAICLAKTKAVLQTPL